MGRKVKPSADTGTVLYDVVYEDGSRSSNRKVPRSEEGDAAIRGYLEAQDRKIAEMSGNPRGPIKTVKKSANQ